MAPPQWFCASAKKAKELGLKPLARIKAFASAGVDPKYMGMGPVPASKRTLSRAGWEPKDLDLMEINEAFAAQAIAVNRQMGWDTKKVNVNGGAIALGHPIGASGCRVLVTLLHEMQKRDARRGLASLCIGGGMGVALRRGTLERENEKHGKQAEVVQRPEAWRDESLPVVSRIAFVSGGMGGIGSAICRRLGAPGTHGGRRLPAGL